MTESRINSAPPVVSVVIGFRDWGLRRIELAAQSIIHSFGKHPGEVIISDFGSQNPEENQALAARLGCKYVFTHGENVWSRSRALNAGFAIAQGDLLVSTDADMIFSPFAMERIVELYKRDPLSAFFLQCRDLPEGYDDGWVATHPNKWETMEAVSRLRPRWGMGGMMAISRKGFESIRGFDERLHTYGGEDLDFAQRARRAGYKTSWISEPSVRMYHMWHPATSKIVDKTQAGRDAVNFNRSVVYNDTTFVRNYLNWKYRPRETAPLVTISICTRNRADLLRETLDSILIQTMQDFEVVIVDDGGNDNTREIVEGYSDPRFRYAWQEATGISAARNHAAQISRGIYTAVVDDDDLMHPRRLEWHLEGLEPGTVGNCGSFLNFDNVTGETQLHVSKKPTFEISMHSGSAPGHSTWFIETEVIRKLRYDESLSSGVDNNLMLRILRTGARVTHIGLPVTLRRMHSLQVTVQDQERQVDNAGSALAFIQWRLNPGDLINVKKIGEEQGEFPQITSREELQHALTPYMPDHIVQRNITLDGSNISAIERIPWDGTLVTVAINFGFDDAQPGKLFTVKNASYQDMVRARQNNIGFEAVHAEAQDDIETPNSTFEFALTQIMNAIESLGQTADYAILAHSNADKPTEWSFTAVSTQDIDLQGEHSNAEVIIADTFLEK